MTPSRRYPIGQPTIGQSVDRSIVQSIKRYCPFEKRCLQGGMFYDIIRTVLVENYKIDKNSLLNLRTYAGYAAISLEEMVSLLEQDSVSPHEIVSERVKNIQRSLCRSIDSAIGRILDITTPLKIRERKVPAIFQNKIAAQDFRALILDRIGDGFYRFFCAIRELLRSFAFKSQRVERPTKVGAYAATLGVELNEIRREVVFRVDNGDRRLFTISSPKAWEILCQLVSSEHPEGLVKLSPSFRAYFISKDKNANRQHDDLWEVDMHIHSAGDGCYRLQSNRRENHKWDR